MLVGGVYDAVYKRILRGQTSELPALLPDLAHTTLLPYLGPDGADAAREALLAE